eukprot:458819_1
MSLLSVIAVLINQYIFVSSQTNHTISCNETRNGYRLADENIEYTFHAHNDYTLVYLEGCEASNYIWLQILNSKGHIIAEERTQCDHSSAHDITIPTNVFDGEEYTFVIPGQTTHGNYSVTLFCFTHSKSPTANHPTVNHPTLSPILPTTNPIPHGTCVYEPLSDKYVCECIGRRV